MSDSERAARYSDLFEEAHGNAGAECAYCPICAGLAVLRRTNPEVIDHLAAAARELLAAAAIVLAEAEKVVGSQPEHAGEPARDVRVRRIDLG